MRNGTQRKPEDSNRWLTTYSDLMTLLLAFFVLLFTMSEIDATKFRELLQGLAAPFGNTGQQADILDGGETISTDEMLEETPAMEIIEEINREDEDDDEDEDEDEDAEPDEGETIDEFEELRQQIQEALDAADIAHHAEMEVDPRGLVISIGTDEVLFETGSAEISSLGEEIIATIAPPLVDIGNEVHVEGHTDTQPIHRPDYDNWNLSSDRALAVLRELKDEHELAPPRLAAIGFGEHRPADTNETAEGRQRNRRVEILVVSEEALHGD